MAEQPNNVIPLGGQPRNHRGTGGQQRFIVTLKKIIEAVGIKWERSNTLTSAAKNVTNAATLIVAANKDRFQLIIYNNGANPVFIGSESVTAADGIPVLAKTYMPVEIKTAAAVYGITAAGTEEVRYVEL